jgi:uncharacterized protein YidB (DUF937 family)
MGLLDSILSAVSGKGDTSGKAAPLIGILSGLLTQSGGLQGLANKFSQSGQGNAFSSWVGLGENQPVSSNQIQEALGSDQIRAIAARMGVDPNLASNFLAEYLPKIVDKLTPTGKWILLPTLSKGWLLCYHRSCRVSAASLLAANPRRHRAAKPFSPRFACIISTKPDHLPTTWSG